MGIFNLFKKEPAETKKSAAKRILVVDDEPSVANALEAILSDHGFQVTVAFNGDDGVASAREEVPDIILMDLMMPQLSGFDACKMIKQDNKTAHIPVLVLTAMQMSAENMEKAFKSGASAYITKPYDTARLLDKINKLLSGADGTVKR